MYTLLGVQLVLLTILFSGTVGFFYNHVDTESVPYSKKLYIDTAFNILKNWHGSTALDLHRDVILLLGPQGVGKTTLLKYLQDLAFHPEIITHEKSYRILPWKNKTVGGILKRNTLYPNLVLDRENRLAFYDLPPISNKENTTFDSVSNIILSVLMKRMRSVKVILVVSYESLVHNADFKDLQIIFQNILNVIKDDKVLKYATALIVTRVNNTRETINEIGIIVRHLMKFRNIVKDNVIGKRSLSENFLNERLINLINIFIEDNTKIGLVKKLNEKKNLRSMRNNVEENNQQYLKKVFGDLSYSEVHKTTFNFRSHSLRQKERENIADKIRGDLGDMVSNVLESITKYFHSLINDKVDFEDLVENIKKTASIFKKVLPEETEDIPVLDLYFHHIFLNLMDIPKYILRGMFFEIEKKYKYVQTLEAVSDLNVQNHIQYINEKLENYYDYLQFSEEFYLFVIQMYDEIVYNRRSKPKKTYGFRVEHFPDILTYMKNYTDKYEFLLKKYHTHMDDSHLKALEVMFEKVNIPHIEFTCNEITNTVKLRGKKIRLSDMKLINCSYVHIEIFATEKILIDHDIKAAGKQMFVTIIAPMWVVIGEARHIDLRGYDARPGKHKCTSRQDENFDKSLFNSFIELYDFDKISLSDLLNCTDKTCRDDWLNNETNIFELSMSDKNHISQIIDHINILLQKYPEKTKKFVKSFNIISAFFEDHLPNNTFFEFLYMKYSFLQRVFWLFDTIRKTTADGESGETGGPGGYFLGIGSTVINGDKLIIDNRGGKGACGQDGRNGIDGRTGDQYFSTKISKCIKEFFYDWGPAGCMITRCGIQYCKNCKKQILPGLVGEYGGKGGKGGSGGYSYSIDLFFSNNSNITIRTGRGINGKNGINGKKGYDGLGIRSNKLACHRVEIQAKPRNYSNIARSDMFDVIKFMDSHKEYRVKPNIHKPIMKPSVAAILLDYKIYFRVSLKNVQAKDMVLIYFKQIEMLEQVEKEYNIETFIQEFFDLEEQYLLQKEDFEFLEYYESFLARLKKYCANLGETVKQEDVYEYQLISNYLFASIQTKLNSLKQSKILLVTDVDSYIAWIKENIERYEEAMREEEESEQNDKIIKEMNKINGKYQDGINKSIEETLSLIENNMKPQIAEAFEKLNEQMNITVKKIAEEIEKKELEIAELNEKIKDLESTSFWRAFCKAFSFIGQIISVLPIPFANVAGAAISAGATIGASFIPDDKKFEGSKTLDEREINHSLELAEGFSSELSKQMDNVFGEECDYLRLIKECGQYIIKNISSSFSLDYNKLITEGINIAHETFSTDYDLLRNLYEAIKNSTLESCGGTINIKNIIENNLQKEFTSKFNDITEYFSELKERAESVMTQISDPLKEIFAPVIRTIRKKISSTIVKTGGAGKIAAKLKKTIVKSMKGNAGHILGAGVDTALDIKHGVEEANSEIKECQAQIAQNKQDIEQLNKLSDSIQNSVTPAISKMKGDFSKLIDGLKNKEPFELDMQKYKLNQVLDSLKTQLLQMCSLFKDVQAEIKTIIKKLSESLEMTIGLFDRIQENRDKMKQANFATNIALVPFQAKQKHTSELMKKFNKLKRNYEAGLILEQYNTATIAIKQVSFPFLKNHVSALTGLFKNNNWTLPQLIKNAKDDIDVFRSSRIVAAATVQVVDEILQYGVFSNDYGSSVPFFVWDYSTYQEDIQNLFAGKEVYLYADLQNAPHFYNVVKFKSIFLRFRTRYGDAQKWLDMELLKYDVHMTHMGTSKYKCGDRYYEIRSSAINLLFSYEMIDDLPVMMNGAYKKLYGGDFILSPYTTWKIKIMRNESNQVRILKEDVDLYLEGMGQHLGAGDCPTDNLDSYKEDSLYILV